MQKYMGESNLEERNQGKMNEIKQEAEY